MTQAAIGPTYRSCIASSGYQAFQQLLESFLSHLFLQHSYDLHPGRTLRYSRYCSTLQDSKKNQVLCYANLGSMPLSTMSCVFLPMTFTDWMCTVAAMQLSFVMERGSKALRKPHSSRFPAAKVGRVQALSGVHGPPRVRLPTRVQRRSLALVEQEYRLPLLQPPVHSAGKHYNEDITVPISLSCVGREALAV